MKYYLDVKVRSSKEIQLPVLFNGAYSQLHKALWDRKSVDVGVSFPEMSERLGRTIRLHSTKEQLESLQALSYLSDLLDYLEVSQIHPVPAEIKGHQSISRVRQTMNEAKLTKRVAYQKANGTLKTEDEVKAYIKQYRAKIFATSLTNPYLEIQSASTNSRYRIYLKFGELQKEQTSGEFNQFGLSTTTTTITTTPIPIATVPVF